MAAISPRGCVANIIILLLYTLFYILFAVHKSTRELDGGGGLEVNGDCSLTMDGWMQPRQDDDGW